MGQAMNNQTESSVLIPELLRDVDGRGSIVSIFEHPVANVSIIRSKAGVIRSNHYHKLDYHFIYVLEGQCEYFFGPDNVNLENLQHVEVTAGSTIFTPPGEWHATFFPIDTLIVVGSKNPRDQATYEADTIRRTLITNDMVLDLLNRFM